MRLEARYSVRQDTREPSHNDGRPEMLINNFTSEDCVDKQRSRSVLFSANKRHREVRNSHVDKLVQPRGDDSCVGRFTGRGQLSNGFRATSRNGSESGGRNNFRTSTPRMTVSRGSIASNRLSSVKSDDNRSPRGYGERNRSGSMASGERNRSASMASGDRKRSGSMVSGERNRSASMASVDRKRSGSMASGERKRSGSMSSDSEDGVSILQTSHSSISAWEMFEEHVKGVTVSSDLVCRKSRVSFASSNTFQQTMTDLYGIPEYGIEPEVPKTKPKNGNFTNAASRLMATNRRWRGTLMEAALKEANERPKPSRAVLETARRGWRIVRRHVQEMISEKKGSNAAFMWSSLTQTVRGLSDMEKTRMDLYKRYGIIPSVQPDGTVMHVNTMLSERARAASATSTSTTVSRARTIGVTSRQSIVSRKSESLWSRTS